MYDSSHSHNSSASTAPPRLQEEQSARRFPDIPWAASMCEKLKDDLWTALQEGGLNARSLRVGTDCAGAEAPVFAMHQIAETLAEQMQVDLRIDHRFACDIMPASRQFISQNCTPTALFCDLLARDTISHCLFAERPRLVPSNLDIYVAGFPCKDFSLLNRARPCLKGPHASIFHGVVQYIERHEPRAFVLENVDGMTLRKHAEEAPIYTVMRILRQIPHYDVRAWKVNSSDYYLPQHRKRVYIVGVHTKNARLRRPLAEWTPFVRGLEHRCDMTAHDFLLPDSDPEVQAEFSRQKEKAGSFAQRLVRASRKRAAQGDESVRGPKWVQQHHALRVRYGISKQAPWQTAAKDRHGGRGWLRLLRANAQDTVDLVGGRVGRKSGQSAENTSAVAEIGRGAAYCSVMHDVTPCITPTGRLWVFSRWRWFLAPELLALQGFPVDDLDLTGLSNSQLGILAGNAMSVPVVGAFLCMVLAMVAFPSEDSEQLQSTPKPHLAHPSFARTQDDAVELDFDHSEVMPDIIFSEEEPSETAMTTSTAASETALSEEASIDANLGSRVSMTSNGKVLRSSFRLAKKGIVSRVTSLTDKDATISKQKRQRSRSMPLRPAVDPLGEVPFPMVLGGSDDWIQCSGCHQWLPVHPEIISIYKDAQNIRFYCRYITGIRCKAEPKHHDSCMFSLTRRRQLVCHSCGELHMAGPNAYQRWRWQEVVCRDLGLQCEGRSSTRIS